MGRSAYALGLLVPLLLLSACGERFPFLERNTRITYGPPFGRANIERAAPHHPADPAGEERHAEPLNEEAQHYGTFARCNQRLTRLLEAAEGGEHHGPVLISTVESVGHHVTAAETEEYRCSGGTLVRRAWRTGGHGAGGHGSEGHGEAH